MGTTYIATLGSEEIEMVVVDTEPRCWRLRCGEREFELDAVQLPSGTWSVLALGRSLLIDVASDGSQVVGVVINGSQLGFKLEDARVRRLAKIAGSSQRVVAKGEIIRAPIAGKVVKLLVAVGDEVAEGTPLIVLEAMKMENELCASKAGQVGSIRVSEGDPVETNQLLMQID